MSLETEAVLDRRALRRRVGYWRSAFVLLGVFPLLARWLVARVQARRVYARWPKPKRFDCNLVVIGAGSAGLVACANPPTNIMQR